MTHRSPGSEGESESMLRVSFSNRSRDLIVCFKRFFRIRSNRCDSELSIVDRASHRCCVLITKLPVHTQPVPCFVNKNRRSAASRAFDFQFLQTEGQGR